MADAKEVAASADPNQGPPAPSIHEAECESGPSGAVLRGEKP